MRLTLRSVNDEAATKTVRARFVVGCDGANSMVRQAMGVEYEDLGFSADWLVVDIKPMNPKDWNEENVQVCDPQRPTTLVSSGPGRRRAEFMLLPGESKEDANNARTAWQLLERHGWTPQNAVLERHAVYTFRGCVARRWRAGRMLLAGDAAHLTPPFAGQGLCAGPRDVAALAWRLHHVLQGHASAALLDSYGIERAEHARRFINFAIELGNVICVLDPAQAAGRDAHFLGASDDEEDRFPESRLPPSDLVRIGDPHAGELSLQGQVEVGARRGRFDNLVGGGFVLLSLRQDVAAQLDEAQRRFAYALGVKIVALTVQGAKGEVVDSDGAYKRWLEALGCETVLIRPDFYLYGGGDAASLIRSLQAGAPWRLDGRQNASRSPSGQALMQGYFQVRQDAHISPPLLKSWQEAGRDDVVLLDVRNPLPANTHRIAGSLPMAERDLDTRWQELPRDKLLVLYGWDTWCSLVPSAALKLVEKGYLVKELSGGFNVWRSLGFPLVEAH